MNCGVKSVFGVSLAGLFIVLAANGAAFVQAAQAAWLFLLNLSTTAPLGVSSFALAFALAVVSQPFLRRWLPHMPCNLSREFAIESAALLVGVAIMWAQLHTLNGLLLGILAGLLAPYVQKGIAAAIALAVRAFQGAPPR